MNVLIRKYFLKYLYPTQFLIEVDAEFYLILDC